MKFRFLLVFLFAATAFAGSFPGVKAILTPQEMALSGLDKLSDGQIAILDAAINRHYNDQVQKAVDARPAPKDTSFGLPARQDWKNLPVLKATVVKWTGGNSFLLDNGQEWEGQEPITFEIVGAAIEIQPRPLGKYALVIPGKAGPARVRRLR